MTRLVYRNSGRVVSAGDRVSDLDGGVWEFAGVVEPNNDHPIKAKANRSCVHETCPPECLGTEERLFSPLGLNLSVEY